MRFLILTFLTLLLNITGHSQGMTFDKFMRLFITGDELKIKTELKKDGYSFQKEKSADVVYFDTQIIGYKGMAGDFVAVRAVGILKRDNKFSALSYISFSSTDFKARLKEINKRGFELTSEDTLSNAWVYGKGDTVITIEKRVINFGGKSGSKIRYEVCAVVVPPVEEDNDAISLESGGVLFSKSDFQLNKPDGWINHPKEDIDEQMATMQKIVGDENPLNETQFMLSPKGKEELMSYPKMYVFYRPMKNQNILGFSKTIETMLSDEVVGKVVKVLDKISPNSYIDFETDKRIIDNSKRLAILSLKTKGEDFEITTISGWYLTNKGLIMINFYIPKEDDYKYKNVMLNTILSLKIKPQYRLEKD